MVFPETVRGTFAGKDIELELGTVQLYRMFFVILETFCEFENMANIAMNNDPLVDIYIYIYFLHHDLPYHIHKNEGLHEKNLIFPNPRGPRGLFKFKVSLAPKVMVTIFLFFGTPLLG